MNKKPFVTKEQVEEIVKKYPTPFHIYDEKGIRENARKLKKSRLRVSVSAPQCRVLYLLINRANAFAVQ